MAEEVSVRRRMYDLTPLELKVLEEVIPLYVLVSLVSLFPQKINFRIRPDVMASMDRAQKASLAKIGRDTTRLKRTATRIERDAKSLLEHLAVGDDINDVTLGVCRGIMKLVEEHLLEPELNVVLTAMLFSEEAKEDPTHWQYKEENEPVIQRIALKFFTDIRLLGYYNPKRLKLIAQDA